MASCMVPERVVPPRSGENMSNNNASALDLLINMGFQKRRADKALAATGHRGAHLAADWLFAHANDTTLDEPAPREYVLYLVPVGGPLLDQINTYWTDSFEQCGRNGAHNLLPHITLCPFFRAPDEQALALVSCLNNVMHRLAPELPATIRLESYISRNFMGLFVDKGQAEVIKRIPQSFLNEINNYVTVTEQVKSTDLHLTLAYQFPEPQFEILDPIAKRINPEAFAEWEVHRAMYSHVPRQPDELELLIGDFVYVETLQMEESPDGWVEGVSWLTGCRGYLPKNYLQRTAESDAWTLHGNVPYGPNPQIDTIQESPSRRLQLITSRLSDVPSRSQSLLSIQDPVIYENVSAQPPREPRANTTIERPMKAPAPDPDAPRRVIVMRHGERVDFTFGTWIPYCYDDDGNYTPMDLNMPRVMPIRPNGADSFFKDCPLTKVGELQATLVGGAFKNTNLNVHHVFVSPSFRCLQTCNNLLTAMGVKHLLPMNIEPGLFEWLGWYQDSMPDWLPPKTLQEFGFNVNAAYTPVITQAELQDKYESTEQYYMRSYFVVQALLKATASKGGTILCVAHAASLDTLTRQLVGFGPRPRGEMLRVIQKVPYCSVAIVTQEKNDPLKWKFTNLPFPPITHSGNLRYDWRVLMT